MWWSRVSYILIFAGALNVTLKMCCTPLLIDKYAGQTCALDWILENIMIWWLFFKHKPNNVNLIMIVMLKLVKSWLWWFFLIQHQFRQKWSHILGPCLCDVALIDQLKKETKMQNYEHFTQRWMGRRTFYIYKQLLPAAASFQAPNICR